MLLTFEDPPQNIKAGWKENLATFMNELKNLQCVGLTTLGAALKNALDVLNLNRMQTGIDTYGQGRCPFYLEPSVIVLITDGGKYTTNSGVHQDFTLPMHSPIPGSELTKEPFRWDQRLFSLVLRLSGTPAIDRDTGLVASDASPIDAMCEVTGGRSYCITSHRMMMQCIDSLVQKVQSGVVINFEKIGPDPPPLANDGVPVTTTAMTTSTTTTTTTTTTTATGITTMHTEDEENEDEMNMSNSLMGGNNTTNGPSRIQQQQQQQQYPPNSTNSINSMTITLTGNAAWHSCRRLIYVPRSAQKGFAVGFWPIPESFWPDLSATSLPPRSAHPNVKFTCTSQEPMVIENLPFDKYELEPSPLTQFILARKQPTVCWQVFVANSYKSSEVGHPFGYLKASTNLTCVNLFVMPYNYPVLLPLLEELFKIHRLKPTNEWRTQFQNYMRTMPTYYAASLRRALTRMGASTPLAQTLIPDNMDNSLSYSVLNYLKRLKNTAKVEFDRLCNDVISKQVANASAIKALSNGNSTAITEGVRVVPRTPLKKDLVSHPLLQDKFTGLRDQLNEFGGFVVGLVRNQQQQRGAQSYRNAFDVPRKSLLDQVVRMRANFLQSGLSHTKLLDDDYVHSMPVAQMGNYQEYLKRMTPPLREIESTPVRQHMFGNPFKIDKRMMVDEADIDIVGSTSSSSSSSNSSAGSLSAKGGLKRTLASADGSAVGGGTPRAPPNKRKPGPIPRDFVLRRPSYSPIVRSPSVSPVPWHVNDMKNSFTGGNLDVNIPSYSTNLSSTAHIPNSLPSSPEKMVNGLGEFSPTMPVFDPIPVDINNENSTTIPGPLLASSPGAPPAATPVAAAPSTFVENIIGSAFTPAIPNSLADSAKISTLNNERKQSADIAPKLEPANKIFNNDCATDSDIDSLNTEIPAVNERLTNHVSDNEKNDAKPEKERQPTKKELEEIRRHNLSIRELVYKEVRRRGTNHGTLFSHLHQIQGTLDIRLSFVRDVVKESLRFKRRNLAKLLEEYLQSVQDDGWLVVNHNKVNHNGATTLS
ncbi:integrator complex subunit 6-B isoform X2 [Venturia canescens]|nr:integrator complex subunit 6-B isoform X2 [Venturia canescens]XP_043283851.1 integrator complex subunit 6-B isoform X2 [Venturia canescens]